VTTRRNFLGGLALLAVSPVLINELDLGPGAKREIEVAQMSDIQREIDKVGPLGTSGIRAALVARINAHWALFGEAPKVLFLSHGEVQQFETSMRPEIRYQVEAFSKMGYDNLLFKGIPVMFVDNQMLIPQEQLR
jgi:hypothetical protein